MNGVRWVFIIFLLMISLVGCSPEETQQSTTAGGASTIPPDTDAGTENGSDIPSEEQTDYFYFSYDDSSSIASLNLALKMLDLGRIPSNQLGRAYEFLSAEDFNHFDERDVGPFKVSMAVINEPIPNPDGEEFAEIQSYHLGVNISGPELSNEERENAVITLLIDVSGSMSGHTNWETEAGITSLLDLTKFALVELSSQLKEGDVINVVEFETDARVLLEGWAYDPNNFNYRNEINGLSTRGSTNLDAGIQLAYEVALRQFNPEKSNTVIMLTDAYANTGVTDVSIISQSTEINELEGIYFSGIGIGLDFQEAFLNELTDAGKGSYFSLVSTSDARKIFSNNLPSLLSVAVEDVRFKLSYPSALDHAVTAAEEISQDKEDVQPTNFSYNNDQFFIESFTSNEQITDGAFNLEIEYLDANNEITTVNFESSLADLTEDWNVEIYKALLIRGLAMLISGAVTCEDVQPYQDLVEGIVDSEATLYSGYITTYCGLIAEQSDPQ